MKLSTYSKNVSCFLGQDLMRKKRKEPELKQISAQAQGIQTRLKYSKSDLQHLEKKAIPKCQAVCVDDDKRFYENSK